MLNRYSRFGEILIYYLNQEVLFRAAITQTCIMSYVLWPEIVYSLQEGMLKNIVVISTKKRSGVLSEPQLTEGLDTSDSDQSILDSHCSSCNCGEDRMLIDILVISDQSYQNTCHIIRGGGEGTFHR
jgi:hypothetical protein